MRSSVLKVVLFNFLIKILYFCPIFSPFFTPTADLEMSIKSEPSRIRESVSTFWNKGRPIYNICKNERKRGDKILPPPLNFYCRGILLKLFTTIRSRSGWYLISTKCQWTIFPLANIHSLLVVRNMCRLEVSTICDKCRRWVFPHDAHLPGENQEIPPQTQLPGGF